VKTSTLTLHSYFPNIKNIDIIANVENTKAADGKVPIIHNPAKIDTQIIKSFSKTIIFH